MGGGGGLNFTAFSVNIVIVKYNLKVQHSHN